MNAPLLSIRDVSKEYSGHRALNHISLDIPKGCIYGLLGPNGAGKTSLIRIINQITAADSGEVWLNGQPISRADISRIGYLPEERGLYKKMQVGEQLLYLGQLKGLTKQEVLQRCKFWFERFDVGNWWKKKLEELSKGMQQKVQFISTVLHEPELIILDEPFTGFDPINAGLIRDEIIRLRDEGTTIIFSTHRMESVEELCDYIALIHQSRLMLKGPISEIIGQFRENIFEVLCEADVIQSLTGAELISSSQKGSFHQIRFRMPEGTSANALLTSLISKTEVHGFSEVLPTVNEIFIKVVKQQS